MAMNTSQGNFSPRQNLTAPFKLQRPVSIAIYDAYADAQKAVDYLSDQKFPVEKLEIVGTDLKSVESVTGRLTWGKVIGSALINAVLWAVGFALLMMILFGGGFFWSSMLWGLLFFAIINCLTAAMIYGATRGERDFMSTSRIVATHYEILGEAEVADQARAIMSGGAATSGATQPATAPHAAPTEL